MTQQPWLLLFTFSPPPLFAFLASFFFGWGFSRLHFGGKGFGKALRILGLEERRVHSKVGSGTRFSWKFSGQCYMVFLPFSGVSLTETCSFLVWFERSLHSAHVTCSGQSCVWPLQEVEGTWIRMGGYEWFRGKWVKEQRGIKTDDKRRHTQTTSSKCGCP